MIGDKIMIKEINKKELKQWVLFIAWCIANLIVQVLIFSDISFRNINISPQGIRVVLYGIMLALLIHGNSCIEREKFPKKIIEKLRKIFTY